MTDKARELLEWVVKETELMPDNFHISDMLDEEIRAYLAEPEVKRDALNEETIRWTYEKTEKNLGIVTLTEYGWFDAGARFAEKHHGIGGEG